jgi:hypothetical protein
MRSSHASARDWEKDRSRLNHDRLKNQLTQELFYVIRVLETGVDDNPRLIEFAGAWDRAWRDVRADIDRLLARYPREASPAQQYDFAPFEGLLPEERARMKREAASRWNAFLSRERPVEKVTDACGSVGDAWGGLRNELRMLGRSRFNRQRALEEANVLAEQLRTLGAQLSALAKTPF